MLNLDLSATERFVSGHPDAFWDGWTMVLFRETPTGYSRRDGLFHEGRWGTAKRVTPDDKGMYHFRV